MSRLARVAQDGTRVRASAGAGSFRREGDLARVSARGAQTRRADRSANRAAALTRDAAAQPRAAAEGLARVEEALAELPAVAAAKRRNGTRGQPRRLDDRSGRPHHEDGRRRLRPAYNIQFATDQASHAIVGVAVSNVGSDQPHLVPMLNQIEPAWGGRDLGGRWRLCRLRRLEAARRDGTHLVMPVPRQRGADSPSRSTHGFPGGVAWRGRMQTEAAKQVYRIRGATAERVHADVRT